MSYIQKYEVVLVTAADGTAEGFTPVVCGFIEHIHYTKVDFAAGVDISIVGEDADEAYWVEADVNASTSKSPRHPTHDVAGAVLKYAPAGANVESSIPICRERIKVSVAQGGDTKTGTFEIYIS